MPIPDFRTVYMIQLLVTLLFAVIFGIQWRQGEGGRSAGLWAAGQIIITAGLMLQVLRDVLLPVPILVPANLLLHAGSLLIAWGIWLEAGSRFPVWAALLLLAADALVLAWFTHVSPDGEVRVLVSAAQLSVVFLSCSVVLLIEGRPWRRGVSRFAALSLAVLGLAHLSRVVLVLIKGIPVGAQPEAGQAAFLLLFAIASISGNIGLLWLRMAAWRHDLLGEIERRRRSEAALARAKEAAEEATMAKSRFLASMSHEIRTPMNAIIGLARLLGRTRLEERQRLHVDRIATAADTLLRMLGGVLDTARLEAGRVEIEETGFTLDDVLDQVAALFAAEAEAKGLAFTIDCDDAVPPRLGGDPTRLAQILINLVGNAVKFTTSGGVVLSVAMEPGAAGAGAGGVETVGLVFTVRDSGPGIARERLEHIFEPFQQADSAVHRRHGGAGLGLAIARQLAGLMGGDIRIDSIAGRGSVFSVHLPFRPGAAPVPVAAAETIRLDGTRILVADDDEINREVAREILEQAGATVETALDGHEAVARALAPGPGLDAVLMDVRMPGLDGLAATARIRDRRDRQALPVIAVTAHALDEERQRCLAAGMNDFVTKPVEPDRLLATLARWVAPGAPADPAAPRPPAGPPLPEAIPGFDIAGTLDRFCGNAALVRRLLGDFPLRCAGLAGSLDRLGAGETVDGALDMIHGLKGAAATLGAEDAARDAARLEAALARQDADMIRTEAAVLARTLAAAVAAVAAADIEAV